MSTKQDRIDELLEKMHEYILNESVIPDPCTWGELAEAQAIAEQAWQKTDEGKELKALQTVKVIFRMDKWLDECIAFFPELPGTNDYLMNCTSYVHCGQHGAASFNYYFESTRPAMPEEYADLLAELTQIYNDCTLKVCKRMIYADMLARKQAVENVK